MSTLYAPLIAFWSGRGSRGTFVGVTRVAPQDLRPRLGELSKPGLRSFGGPAKRRFPGRAANPVLDNVTARSYRTVTPNRTFEVFHYRPLLGRFADLAGIPVAPLVENLL